MVYYARIPLRLLIPTVVVHLQTDDGELTFRARWRDSARRALSSVSVASRVRMRASRSTYWSVTSSTC